MLFFVLADFDSPFNGFFRVDVSLIAEVVQRAEALYEQAVIRENIEARRVPTGGPDPETERDNSQAIVSPHTHLVKEKSCYFDLHRRKNQDQDSGFSDKLSRDHEVSQSSDLQIADCSDDSLTSRSTSTTTGADTQSCSTADTPSCTTDSRSMLATAASDNTSSASTVRTTRDIQMCSLNCLDNQDG